MWRWGYFLPESFYRDSYRTRWFHLWDFLRRWGWGSSYQVLLATEGGQPRTGARGTQMWSGEEHQLHLSPATSLGWTTPWCGPRSDLLVWLPRYQFWPDLRERFTTSRRRRRRKTLSATFKCSLLQVRVEIELVVERNQVVRQPSLHLPVLSSPPLFNEAPLSCPH